MARSILEGVVNDLVNKERMKQFIDKVHASSGVPKDKLTEVYNQGVKFALKSGKHALTTAKANVFSYVNSNSKTITEVKELSEINEGDRHERTSDRLNRGAKAMFDKAIQRGLSSEDLYRQARLADKMGEPKTDALFKAGDMLAKHEKRMFGESDDQQSADEYYKDKLYGLWDSKDKKWVSKHVPRSSLKRLRNRADKLDNEYGAYRYQVKEVK